MSKQQKVEREKSEEEAKVGIQDVRFDISTIVEGGLLEVLKNPGKTLKTALGKTLGEFSVESYVNATKSLNEEAFRLARSLGVTSKRTRELTVAVADAIPGMVSIGLEVKDAGLTMSNLFESLNTNMTLGKGTLVGFAAASKVTGVEQKTLAVNFRDVGIGIASIGPKLLQVTKIAQQAGVTVKAVADSVVANLDKMNLYNFDGGIKGLAKMAAQASRLGVSMDGVFGIVDKVFNPEGAINLAASLQRLGVTTSDLLDPLRLMDLSQNDPAELQNQIVNMTKEFTRFNKENNQTEILPGAKRILNEIWMAINAGNFEEKLKQVRIPDLPINEDTRNLIATMAQINERGETKISVAQEDGTGKLTGEYIEKEVKLLTERDIKLIEKQQVTEAQTMEELAVDQLDELRKLNSSMNQILMAQRYGVASSMAVSGGYKNLLGGITSQIQSPEYDAMRKTETYRGAIGDKSIGDLFKMSVSKLKDLIDKGLTDLGSVTFDDLKTNLKNFVKSSLPIADVLKDWMEGLLSSTEVNSNVEHTGTIKQEIIIKHNWDNMAGLDPAMKKVAEGAINRSLTDTEFQVKLKEGTKMTFEKNLEPKTIITS